jgi:hypothetical protein
MSEMTTSIVLYGEIDKYDTKRWIDFYNYSKEIANELSPGLNYIGLIGEEFKSGKVLTTKRIEKRLLKSLSNGNSLSSMALYSLPNDFKQAAFDYNFYLGRDVNEYNTNTSKIVLTLPTDTYMNINNQAIISSLKEFIQFKEGEVFELSRFETPMIYAMRVTDIGSFKTLNVLSTF